MGCSLQRAPLQPGTLDADLDDARSVDASDVHSSEPAMDVASERSDAAESFDANLPDANLPDASVRDADARIPDAQFGDTGGVTMDTGLDGADPPCIATGEDVCDGVDNDCDPTTADGSAQNVGAACDGADMDSCLDGIRQCHCDAISCQVVCTDDGQSSGEVCNGLDDDCDGSFDEGRDRCGESCRLVNTDRRSYLFCTGARTWTEARTYCRNRVRYRLATVGTQAEHDFLWTEAGRSGNWWIGLNDREDEGTWVWDSGGSATFRYWADNEPNNGNGSGEQDCTRLWSNTDGRWDDYWCNRDQNYICEATH